MRRGAGHPPHPRQPPGRGHQGQDRAVLPHREGQFLVELEARGGARDLAELNTLFSAWVEVVYHRRVHSETKATPLARFLSAGVPALPSPELLHEAFLWSELRRVAKVSLHGNSFEVDAALVGRRVELVFDPLGRGQ